MSISRSLYELFRQCTVRISTSANSQGTGFFIAPGFILTCAHVIKQDDKPQQRTVMIRWNYQTYTANIEQIRDKPYPDIALLSVACPDHPYVYLGEEIQEFDRLYCYGYPDDYPDGDSATFEYEGPADEHYRLIKLKSGQVRPGLSGAPLLNTRTGRVCGIVKSTRDRETSLGGRAIPIATVLQEFEQVKIAQRQDNSPWNETLENANPTHLPNETISYFSLLSTFLELEGQWFQDDFEYKRIYIPEKEYFDQLKAILATRRRALLLGHSAAGKTVLAITFARHLQEHAGYTICYKDVKQAEVGDGRKWYALTREHDRPGLLYILDNCHLLPAEVDEFCRQWKNQAPTYTQCLLISRTALADSPPKETRVEEDSYFQMFTGDEKIHVSPERIFWKVIEQYVTSLSPRDTDYIAALKSDDKEQLTRQHAHNLVISRSYLDAWQALGATHPLSEIRQEDTYQALEKKYLSVYGTALATLCVLQRYEVRVYAPFVERRLPQDTFFVEERLPPDEVRQLEKEKLLIKAPSSYGPLYDLILHPSEARELLLAYVYHQYGYITPEHIKTAIISTLETYLKTQPPNYVTVYESLALHKRDDILEPLLKSSALQACAASRFNNKETVLDAIYYIYLVAKFDREQAATLIRRVTSSPGIEAIRARLFKSTFQVVALCLQYISFIDSKLAQQIVNNANIEQLARQAKEENIQSLFRLVRTLQEIAPPGALSQAQALLQAIPLETLAAKMTISNLQDTIKQLQGCEYRSDRLKRLIETLDIQRFAQQSESTSLQSLFWALHTLKKVSPTEAQKLLKYIPLEVLSAKASAGNLGSIDQIVHYMREFGYSSEQIAEFAEALDMEQVASIARQGNLRRLTALLRTLKSISTPNTTKLIKQLTPADITELLQQSSLKAIGGFLQDQYTNRNVREGYALFQEKALEHRLGVEPLDEINKFLDHLHRIRHAGPRLAHQALDLLIATNLTERLTRTDLNQYALLLWHARSLDKTHQSQLLIPLLQPDWLQAKLAQSSLHCIQLLILNVAHTDVNYLQPVQQTLPTINIIEKFTEASLKDISYFLWNIYKAMDKQMAREYSLLVDRHLQVQKLEEASPEDVCLFLWNIISISNTSPLRLFDDQTIHRLLRNWREEAGWSAVLSGIAAIAQIPIRNSEYLLAMHIHTEALHNWFTTSNEGHSLYFLALALQGLRTYEEEFAYTIVRNVFLHSDICDRLQSARSSAMNRHSLMLIEGTLQWLEKLFAEMK